MFDKYLVLKKIIGSWRFIVIYMFIGLLHATPGLKFPSIHDLLTYDISVNDQIVVFKQSAGNMNAIVNMRIYFLGSEDCQSGYTGFYDTEQPRGIFPIYKNVSFGLNAAAVYQAGVVTLNLDKVEKAHSILIRFIGNTSHFTQFTGSCNDQGINCCIPIDCSNQVGQCLAKHELELQTFTEYIPPKNEVQLCSMK